MEAQENKRSRIIISSIISERNKIVIGSIISLCTLLIVYFGMAIYFRNHFYFGSVINGINVSGKTVQEAEEKIASELQSYTLSLEEREDKKEQITAADISLKYNSNSETQNLKDKQNPYKWVLALFSKEDSKMTQGVSYDKDLLKEKIDKLSCFDSSNIVEPQNPSFKYTEAGYVIVDEVKGNKINKDILYDQVVNAILNHKTKINLDASNCYVNPQYTSKDQKVIDTKNLLNKYVSSKITYTFGDKSEVLNGSTINDWLKVDENLQITFDEEKIKNYLSGISNTYDTFGKTRNFVTSSGNTIQVSGGDYGWLINREEEAKSLIAAIKEGQTITKEPIYKQTAVSHGNNDIGNTYVEVDITRQHLWFYKNGSLVVEGNVVTGNVSQNHSTPAGVYRVKYKQRNTVLRGADYAVPVSFWMPFNGGVGLHDANWRNVFGGNIYLTNGSHGCVNTPYYVANAVFNNIEEGNPVVVHY